MASCWSYPQEASTPMIFLLPLGVSESLKNPQTHETGVPWRSPAHLHFEARNAAFQVPAGLGHPSVNSQVPGRLQALSRKRGGWRRPQELYPFYSGLISLPRFFFMTHSVCSFPVLRTNPSASHISA
ncbi:hypothetical protein H1C71_028822 [Ictidomys tridecemlineatus]|nr:hypothetical protein H1C71_028822 [Ictidomys tridecemlineatus]